MLSWGHELGSKDASRLVESWISRRIGGLVLMHLFRQALRSREDIKARGNEVVEESGR